MNPDLDRLRPYPFERLRALLADVAPAALPGIALTVGEPKHAPPAVALEALAGALGDVGRYPTVRGSARFRESVGAWLDRRFGLGDPAELAERHVLPVAGTREGLFAIAQTLLDPTARRRSVLMPNPFYRIYEGAALMGGGVPELYPIGDDADADLDAIDGAAWSRCRMVYVCTPGNPTGAVASREALGRLVLRAQEHGFTVVSDECYGEIYREAAGPPPGLLEAARAVGVDDFRHCLSFHSLSKRSNLPGLRSGFVAGDARILARFLEYRTYHGATLPGFVEAASVAAWGDEAHVRANRAAYDAKYAAVAEALAPHLDVPVPPGGFYLWPRVPIDDETLVRRLLAEANVRAVPGSYLARDAASLPVDGRGEAPAGPSGGAPANPGERRLRLALVAPHDDCAEAARRIAAVLSGDTDYLRERAA